MKPGCIPEKSNTNPKERKKKKSPSSSWKQLAVKESPLYSLARHDHQLV